MQCQHLALREGVVAGPACEARVPVVAVCSIREAASSLAASKRLNTPASPGLHQWLRPLGVVAGSEVTESAITIEALASYPISDFASYLSWIQDNWQEPLVQVNFRSRVSLQLELFRGCAAPSLQACPLSKSKDHVCGQW